MREVLFVKSVSLVLSNPVHVCSSIIIARPLASNTTFHSRLLAVLSAFPLIIILQLILRVYRASSPF